MKCIVLCASHGEVPKSLTRIDANLTALDNLLEKVKKIKDINKIYIVTNGESYQHFARWYSNINHDSITLINDNTTSPKAELGAIGDIKYTLNIENIDDEILVIAGDAYYNFDFDNIYTYYKEKNSPVVAVKRVNSIDLKKFGSITFDKNNKVIDMSEKSKDSKGDFIALALYFYPKNIIRIFENYLQEGGRRTSPGYFLEYLYNLEDTYAYEVLGEYNAFK